MSRHRFVKALNIHDEFEDYDGVEDIQEEEEDPEGREQMRVATIQAQNILGDSFPVAEIQKSLWHYYYDVEQTVEYLLKKKEKAASQQKKQPTQSVKKKAELLRETTDSGYGQSFSVQDFFEDCPWMNIPEDRKALITMEPLQLRRGLLGGASTGAPKQSKLAALAAARRKKENEKPGASATESNSSVALLDRLSLKTKDGNSRTEPSNDQPSPLQKHSSNTMKQIRQRKYQRKLTQDESMITQGDQKKEETVEPPQTPASEEIEAPVASEPSAFAKVLFGPARTQPPEMNERLLTFNLYPKNITENPFAGPSPDDVVAKAQSASKGLNKTKSNVDEVNKQLEQTALDKNSRVKSKNLDVVAEYERKEHKLAANFVVVGHVDSGKSTLMGRLLHDLKVVDERTISKYRRDAETMGKSSFALAWVMDSRSEERSRGVTIDIATNQFETDAAIFTILDAPGHQDFVPNMIAGASQADFAILVIDGSGSNFESGLRGQTREHALLVRSLGVQALVVAVNKLETTDWSRERFDEITQQSSSFLIAAGFNPKNVAFVPLSGLHGDNVITRSQNPAASWYEGHTLLQELEARAKPKTFAIRGPLRLPVSDVLTGDVVHPLSLHGRLVSGSVQVGDPLVIVPSNKTGYVKAIDIDGESADFAVAGQNAALHVSGLDPEQVRAGDIVCAPADPAKARKEFVLKALVFEHITPMYLSVIVGRADVEARVEALMATLVKGSGRVLKKKPKIIKPGEVARLKVAVETERGIALDDGARVVLRASGVTVATGLVE